MFLFCRDFSASSLSPRPPSLRIMLSLSHSLFTRVSLYFIFFCVAEGIVHFFPTYILYTYINFIYYSKHIFFELLRSRLCNVNIVLHTYLVYSFSDIPLSTPHERPRLFFVFFFPRKLCLFTF